MELKYFLISSINAPNTLVEPCEEEESKYLYLVLILNRVHLCYLNLWKVSSQSTLFFIILLKLKVTLINLLICFYLKANSDEKLS